MKTHRILLLGLALCASLLAPPAAQAQVYTKLDGLVDHPNTREGITYRVQTRQVSADYTLKLKDDHTILADATAGAITIALPAAGTNTTTRVYCIQKTDVSSNAVTVTPNGSEKIDGQSTIVLGSQYATVYLQAGFGAWHIVGGNSQAGDSTVFSDATGGNLGAKNTLTAALNISLVSFATMTNGSTETTSWMDDTPAADFSAVTVGVAPTDTEDTSYARVGSKSLKLAWPATSVAGDGVSASLTSDNLEANESVGMWIYTSEALSAGDLTLVLTDDGGARTFNIPAVATANVWTWVEVDVSSLTGGTGDAITAYAIKLSSAGATAHGAFTTYIDGVWKWDSDDELALGVDVLDQPGSIRGFITITKADAGTTAHTLASLVDGTDYFVHRESGNDFLVQITDQSAKTGFTAVLHKE